MNRVRPLRLLPSALALAFLPRLGHAVQSDFDLNNEGWQTCNVDFVDAATTVNGFQAAAYSATGGNPGGSILFFDNDAGWNFFAAPAAFLGDQSATFGSSLAYDTETDGSDPASVYPAVVLRSGSTFLYNLTAPPAASWSHVSVPLTGASWSLSPTGGSAVDDGTLQGVLAHLDGLYIEADWTKGTGETARLDNVNLSPVPEPSFLALLPLGFCTFRGRRRA